MVVIVAKQHCHFGVVLLMALDSCTMTFGYHTGLSMFHSSHWLWITNSACVL